MRTVHLIKNMTIYRLLALRKDLYSLCKTLIGKFYIDKPYILVIFITKVVRITFQVQLPTKERRDQKSKARPKILTLKPHLR
jgi:hypothetical protein